MKVIIVIGVLLSIFAFHGNVKALQFSAGSLFNSAKQITTGVVSDAGNLLPTPKGLFETGKNLIAGYPVEFVAFAMNQICSSALSSETIQPKVTPDIQNMNFQIRTACKKETYPLTNADGMWRSSLFDPAKKVVILVTGWTTQVNTSDTIDVLSKAYNCRGDTNFIALDAASYVDTLYSWSAFNTDIIGEYMAVGLANLVKIVPLANIHLVGHSLGAHIVGAAARYFNEKTDLKIPRVTGLDPAKPCFNEGENLAGLQRGDSDFVDVIHSNPGVLGKREPTGDMDFYPGGLAPLITGCFEVVCAHAKSWRMYAESVYPGNENNFLAQRCSSLTRLRENKCPGKSFAMGYAVDTSAKGNYFLDINANSPYGKNSKASATANDNCGVCTN